MKKLLFIAIGLCLTLTIAAQDENEKKVRHSIGLNVKSIIGISDFGFFSTPSSPYKFSYRYDFDKWGIRFGFGGSYSNQKTDAEENQAQNEFRRSETDIRLGLDRQILSFKGFTAHAGLDLIYDQQHWLNKNKPVGQTEFTESETSVKGYGLGPVLVLQYHINKHISLGTEGAFYLSKFRNEYRNVHSGTNFEEERSEQNGWNSTQYEAAALYLNVRF